MLRRILRGGRHEVAFQRAGHHYGGKQPARYGVGRALREEGAKTLSVCRSSEGLARCGEAGLSAFPLMNRKGLPERCRGLLGEPPAHLVDLMHSRFESLIAGAAPEAIMEWAAVDIGLRARLVRAVDAPCWPAGSGVACSFHPAPPSARLKDRGIMRPPSWLARLCTGALPVELSGRGITACSLRLSWLDAGRGAVFLERRREAVEKRMPIGRLVRMDEAVETVLFLLSASASSVNGTVVTLGRRVFGDENHILRIEWITRK